MVLFATANGTGMLIAARAVQGISVGIATGALGAALIDLSPPNRPGRGTLVNSSAPTFGMAFGAIAAGLLVEYGPHPTVLSYVILLAFFVVAAGAVFAMPETAPDRGRMTFRPRQVHVPSDARRPFAILSVMMIADWAVGGLYLSLGPSLVAVQLHNTNHVLGGLVVTLLAGFGTVAQFLFHRLSGQRAMVLGSVFMFAAIVLTVIALAQVWLWLFLVATGLLGLGWGTTFMGAFRGMAALAPAAHRAEILAAIYVVAYLAFSLPAVGAGIAVIYVGLHTTTTVYIVVVAALILLALLAQPIISRHDRRLAAAATAAESS
jgi:MFS family permease